MTRALVLIALPLALVPSAAGAGATNRLGPAEACPGAIKVTDPPHDMRSWNSPAFPPEAFPLYGDLRSFEVRATAAGVCVRWTTAAPAPTGATFGFGANGPFINREAAGYGIDLVLHKGWAVATYGLDRLGSRAKRVVPVRAGRTGSVVSAFIPIAGLDRPPANDPGRPPFPYRGFTFQANVLTAPDPRGNQVVDFWPQETQEVQIAADIDGHLCFPCHDRRFLPFG